MRFALDWKVVVGTRCGLGLDCQLLATIGTTSSLLAHKLSPTNCNPVWDEGWTGNALYHFSHWLHLANQSEQSLFFSVVIANNEDRAIFHDTCLRCTYVISLLLHEVLLSAYQTVISSMCHAGMRSAFVRMYVCLH